MAKKAFFTMVAAAGMLTLGSCSQDEVITSVTDQGDEIAFTAGVDKASRHTGDVTTDNLNSFYVTAFLRDPEYDPEKPGESPDANSYFIWSRKEQNADGIPNPGTGTCLFFNQEFVRQGNTQTFKINRRDPYHWPGSGQYVTFFAFSPSLDILNDNGYGANRDMESYPGAYILCYRESDQRLSFEELAFSRDISEQVDFIVSDPVTDHRAPGEYGNKARDTRFNFKHLLSQVQIKVKTTAGSLVDNSYDVYVAGVKLSSCTLGGSYSLTDCRWTDTSNREHAQVYYYFTDKDEIVHVGYEPESVMGNGGNAMTIPQKVAAWDLTSNNMNAEMYLGLLIRVVHKDGRCVFPYADKYCYDYDTAPYEDRYDKFAYHVGPDGKKYQWAAIPFSCDWEASKKYIYTIDLSKGVGYNDPGDEATGTGGELILNGEVTISETVEDWKVGGDTGFEFEIIEPVKE